MNWNLGNNTIVNSILEILNKYSEQLEIDSDNKLKASIDFDLKKHSYNFDIL